MSEYVTLFKQWQLSLQQTYRRITSAAAAVGLEVFVALWRQGEAVQYENPETRASVRAVISYSLR